MGAAGTTARLAADLRGMGIVPIRTYFLPGSGGWHKPVCRRRRRRAALQPELRQVAILRSSRAAHQSRLPFFRPPPPGPPEIADDDLGRGDGAAPPRPGPDGRGQPRGSPPARLGYGLGWSMAAATAERRVFGLAGTRARVGENGPAGPGAPARPRQREMLIRQWFMSRRGTGRQKSAGLLDRLVYFPGPKTCRSKARRRSSTSATTCADAGRACRRGRRGRWVSAVHCAANHPAESAS